MLEQLRLKSEMLLFDVSEVFWLKTIKPKKIITYQCFAALRPDPYWA